MDPYQNGVVGLSRDLGVWAADNADVLGVDEVSMCMRAVGMMLGPHADESAHSNMYDEGVDLFEDLPPAYPPVFGA